MSQSTPNNQPSSNATPSSQKNAKAPRNFWVVKIPKWVASEIWDNEKYPEQRPVAAIKVCSNSDETGATKFHLLDPIDIETPSYNNIPRDFSLKQRPLKKRLNFIHGKTREYGNDDLLIFSDKPCYLEGNKIEAPDTNLNRYQKGTIIKISPNRKYTIKFDNGHTRENVAEKEIRIVVPDPKADQCKKIAKTTCEFDLNPEQNAQYDKFLRERKAKDLARGITQVQELKEDYEKSENFDDDNINNDSGLPSTKIANVKKTLQDAKKKDLASKKPNRVRKEKEYYRTVIMDAFNTNPTLTKKQIEDITQEPWTFLKDVVAEICAFHSRQEAKNYGH